MRAGRLRHRVQIQAWSETRDTHGGVTETWEDPGTPRWASVEPLQGREQWFAEQTEATVSHRIRMRGGASITPKDRIAWDGRVFQVEVIKDTAERRIELELMCREVVP